MTTPSRRRRAVPAEASTSGRPARRRAARPTAPQRQGSQEAAADIPVAEREILFRTIANTVPYAILMTDSEGVVRFWNPASERIFGYTRDEALGANALQLVVPPGSRRPHEKALRGLRTAAVRAALSRITEGQAQRKDGSLFDVEVLLSAVEVGGRWCVLAVVQDVTRQHETTRVLTRERILLRTLIDALPDSIYVKDREARKTLANPADLRNFGKAREEDVLGRTDLDLLDGEVARVCYADDLRVITTGEPLVDREEFISSATGERRWLKTTKLPLRDDHGQIVGLVGIGHDITQRRQADEQLRRLSLVVEQSPATVIITDTDGRIEYVNPTFCAVTGYEPAEVLGQNPRVVKSGETPQEVYRDLWNTITSGREWRGEFHNRKKNGTLFWESVVVAPLKDSDGKISHYLSVKEDITERKRAEAERSLMELHLRQAQKLESIGQLAAGIAHEINTPMQYVGDNIRFLRDAFGELGRVLGAFRSLRDQLSGVPGAGAALAAAEAALEGADVEYLLAETPAAIDQSLDGVTRVTKIVQAMKEFSHPGVEHKTAVDLNHAIESTVTVARNEWKYVADLDTDLDPELPFVPCLPGELNQVLLNLIINAAHAIADVVRDSFGVKGRITIRTRQDGPWAEIRIEDTGTGIPEAARGRIFDPFFTTKAVGKGTGQGLFLARSVVVDKHGGTLTFETDMGQGTAFIIRLPLAGETAAAAATRGEHA
jgi:two-component system, NtrC family, sensor kinase